MQPLRALTGALFMLAFSSCAVLTPPGEPQRIMKLAELSQQEINLTFAVDPARSHLYFHNVRQEVIQCKSTQNTTAGEKKALFSQCYGLLKTLINT